MTSPSRTVTAALLIIGDEILSGRTQDTNLRSLALFLAPFGVELREVRVVPDIHETIVSAVNALRAAHDYLFTTGGIGPTHDDITADAVAAAFGVSIGVREDALAILKAYYATRATEINEGRLRMARIPEGATLILNPVSGAPGFQIGNVFVLAGVPSIMRAMLEDVGPRLQGGARVLSSSLRAAGVREGDFAAALGEVAKARPHVSIGSYPFMQPAPGGGTDYGVTLVVRGREIGAVGEAVETLSDLLLALNVQPEISPIA
jgi:molybdenum cofactor synthesis domain-containing protein